MKKSALFILLFCFTITNLLAKGNFEKPNDKLKIGVSILPEKTFIEQICKDKAEVIVAIPKGGSPENYELTLKERTKIDDSQIFFTIGIRAENLTILPYLNKETKIIYLEKIVSKKYDDLKIGNERDPHIWLSPKRVIVMIEEITKQVSILDKKNKDFYYKNSQEFIEKLIECDNKITKLLSNISTKSFIIFHPSLGYFASDFNLEQIPLQKQGKEATAKYLTQTLNLAKKLNIKNIYYQAEISSNQCITFANELGGKAIKVDPLSLDYINNLELIAKTFKENSNE